MSADRTLPFVPRDPPGTWDDEAVLFADVVMELEALEGRVMDLHLPAVAAFQIAALLQLALRHPDLAPSIREIGERVIASVGEFFQDTPAIGEVLRRGNYLEP